MCNILYDISGNNNHGTLTNGASFDRIGMGFDGTNDYVSCSNIFGSISQQNITVTAWILIRSGYGIIFISNNITGLIWYAGTTLKQRVYAGGSSFPGAGDSNTFLSANKWAYITIIISNKTVSYFLDGISDGTGSIPNDPNFNSQVINLGGYGSSETLNGQLEDVRIYSRALSQSEILRNFNATRARFGV